MPFKVTLHFKVTPSDGKSVDKHQCYRRKTLKNVKSRVFFEFWRPPKPKIKNRASLGHAPLQYATFEGSLKKIGWETKKFMQNDVSWCPLRQIALTASRRFSLCRAVSFPRDSAVFSAHYASQRWQRPASLLLGACLNERARACLTLSLSRSETLHLDVSR